jgi:molybdate transport system substrate-binding protein
MLTLSRRIFVLGALAPAFPRLSWAQSEEIRVICSGGFTAAYKILAPRFEQITGKKVASAYGASMGNAPDAIPQRLARGEPTDIIILARSALDEFAARGVVRPDSRVDLAESRIGVVVRAGAPKPDISTVDALRRTLLDAPSIAYSASASGVYVSTELYKKLGIDAEVTPKSRRILSERVAAVVARGEADIGFQQISEIIGVQGAELVGALPAAVQQVTVFSAGVLTNAGQPEAAVELIRFLASANAAETVASTGLDPIALR